MFSSFPDWSLGGLHRGAGRRGGLVVLVGALFHASPAMAEVEPRLTVDASVFLSSNPFLIPGSDLDTAIGEASARPAVRITSDRGSSLELSGVLTKRIYSRKRYKDFLIGNARAEGSYRHSERLSVLASAEFDRGILADQLTSGVDAAAGGQGLREDITARFGLEWQPNRHLQVDPDVTYVNTNYMGSATTFLRDTRIITPRLTLWRRTSAYTRLGGRVQVEFNSPDHEARFKTVSGFVTIDQRLSEHWELTAEAGAERIGAHNLIIPGLPPIREKARTRFAGRVDLCHEGQRLTLCANASLASEPSGFGGSERRLAGSLSARHRVSERVTLVATGEYQHARLQGADLSSLDALRAEGRVEWNAARNFRIAGSVEYRRQDLLTGEKVKAGFVGLRLSYDWRRKP
ncbi:MAG TPA: hypothetical protein VJM81_08405 [Rhizorhapis sp.]|nr:hypothetical protein [Rhizorhapis sp.]